MNQTNQIKPIKYPKCLATAGRSGNLIFSIQSNMRAMEQEDINNGLSPLTTFKPWASLNLSFADASKQSGGSGNIEIDHIADVKLRTAIAMEAVMEAECKEKGKTEKGHAQELLEQKVFFLPPEFKEHKGKTAEAIAEAIGMQNAYRAADNLDASANKDPRYAVNNRKQAEALRLAALITETRRIAFPDGETVAKCFSGDLKAASEKASRYYQAGNQAGILAGTLFQAIQVDPSICKALSNEGSSSGSQIYKIYGPVLKTPNTRKVDANGYTKAYTLAVTCDPSRTEYPFRVELTTMLGRPLPNSQVGVDGKSIKDRKSFTIDLQTWEWVNMIERSDWEKKMVEMMFHNTGYQIMLQADADNYNTRQQRAPQIPQQIPLQISQQGGY